MISWHALESAGQTISNEVYLLAVDLIFCQEDNLIPQFPRASFCGKIDYFPTNKLVQNNGSLQPFTASPTSKTTRKYFHIQIQEQRATLSSVRIVSHVPSSRHPSWE